MNYDNQLWSPKLFEFNNHWLYYPYFPELVLNSWFSFSNPVLKDFILMRKLRSLKSYNKWIFGNLDLLIESCSVVVSNLDLQDDQKALSDEELKTRSKDTLNLCSFLRLGIPDYPKDREFSDSRK